MSLRKKLVLIFVSNTFHHLPDPSSYFVHIRHALRPEGRVAIIEVSSGSFPKGHDTKPKDIQEQMQAAGFRLAERHEFLERQSFQIFVPSD
jgi:SAM-dependent methyltransferase